MKSPCCGFCGPIIGLNAEPQPWGPVMTSATDELIQIPTPRKL